MWVYSQSTGHLWDDNGDIISTGYSGFGSGKNNSDLQHIRDVGPIPRGFYKIGKPYNSARVGPHALPLTPVDHDCCGRSDFLMHGDKAPPESGLASKGCIIQRRSTREAVTESDDDLLKVIQ